MQLVGPRLWSVALHWQRSFNRSLAELDLTHRQFIILDGVVALSKTCECVTQAALADQTRGDTMTTSTVVRRLVKDGLLERSAHPTDARANHLELSVRGTEVWRDAHRIARELDQAMFGEVEDAVVCALEACLEHES